MVPTTGFGDKVDDRTGVTCLWESSGVGLDIDGVLGEWFQVIENDSHVGVIADVHCDVNGLPAASAKQAINQSVSQSEIQSVNQPTKQWRDWWMNDRINRSTNQLNEWMNEPTNQPTNEWMNQ